MSRRTLYTAGRITSEKRGTDTPSDSPSASEPFAAAVDGEEADAEPEASDLDASFSSPFRSDVEDAASADPSSAANAAVCATACAMRALRALKHALRTSSSSTRRGRNSSASSSVSLSWVI